MAYYRALFSRSFVRILFSIFFYTLIVLGYYVFFPQGKDVILDLAYNFNYTTVDQVAFFALMNIFFTFISFGITLFLSLFISQPMPAKKPRLAEITLERPMPAKEPKKEERKEIPVAHVEPVVAALKPVHPAHVANKPVVHEAPKKIQPHPKKRVIQF